MWLLSIKVTGGIKIGIYVVIYHSPSESHSSFLTELEKWLDDYEQISNWEDVCIIIGDFNINMLKQDTYSKKLKNILNLH